jgi:hypothetical protein
MEEEGSGARLAIENRDGRFVGWCAMFNPD